jgi:hypothetical protein
VSVPKAVKPFLFSTDYHSSSMIFTFSGKFASEAELLAHRRQQLQSNLDLQTLSQKLSALRSLSSNWSRDEEPEESLEQEEDDEDIESKPKQKKAKASKVEPKSAKETKQVHAAPVKKKSVPSKRK